VSPGHTLTEVRHCAVPKSVQFRMDALPAPDPALASPQDLARIKKRVVSAGG